MSAAVASRRRHTEQQSTFALLAQLSGPAKTIIGALILVGGGSVAWNQLDLWKPASMTYVDGKVAIVSKKVDAVGVATLQNRSETLTAAKQRDEGEASELQMKLQLASTEKGAPTDYVRMLKARLQEVTDQIATITNQINGIQQNITAKNAEAAK